MSGADEVLSFTNALKHLHARRLCLRAGFVYLMNDPILKRFWGPFTLLKACQGDLECLVDGGNCNKNKKVDKYRKCFQLANFTNTIT